MTQEQKQLLLKDLCARLPYGVIIEYNNDGCSSTRELGLGSLHDFMFDNAKLKPYLRPMSSMTEEEKMVQQSKMRYEGYFVNHVYYHTLEEFDYLNYIHVDYRGLTEKGLALEAPDGMYNKR